MAQTQLALSMRAQPDDTTCGPTCLHAIYRYFGDDIELEQVIAETAQLKHGGTLDVFLANHALRRGYRAIVYPYNLHVFDPTWFDLPPSRLRERLAQQIQLKHDQRLRIAGRGYLEFLDLGGELRLVDLTPALIRRYLKRGLPILTGLSATYLYRTVREIPETCEDDDLRGEPVGHFVVIYGYDNDGHKALVADPYSSNPVAGSHYYSVSLQRLIGAILLGIMTFDANLLIIEPRTSEASS